MEQQTVVIAGGGFAGIQAALELSCHTNLAITLVSRGHHFEYYPGMHKLLGVSHRGIHQVLLKTIFRKSRVQVLVDEITTIDVTTKSITTLSGQRLQGDFLIIALGGETEFFGIPGLEETAFGFRSVMDARRLRNHIEEMFEKHARAEKSEAVVALHIVVVGAGPNGVDLAGELAARTQCLAQKYGIQESLVTIDLIEGSSRVLPMMSEQVSRRVAKRLGNLGVNILCNRDLKKEDSWTVTLADMTLGARTLVWTAGITTNKIVAQVPELEHAKRGRVVVDEFLQAQGFENVFCVGDNADTLYSGLAQTAIHNASYVAQVIRKKVTGKPFHSYTPKPVAYNIGVGPRWSVLVIGKFVSFGLIPYIVRTLIDFKYFLSILPWHEVIKLYFSKQSHLKP